MAKVREILKESLPLLLAMAVLEVIAGSFLGRMEASLERLPGLLALVPAILAMRGNISTSMGSRFGTMTRFGLLKGKWNEPIVVHNVVASLVLGAVLSVAAAALAHWVTVGIGLPSVGILPLAAIALLAGTVSGLLMGGVALLTMRVAFRRGLDLDNVAGPVLMTASDVLTLISLFGSAQLVGALV